MPPLSSPHLLHRHTSFYTLDHILSQWNLERWRNRETKGRREIKEEREKEREREERMRGRESGCEGRRYRRRRTRRQWRRPGAAGVKGGRAFICFSGHGGGWLRHVLVVMVTFWACQRGDPSCCRLRRPETLILRDLPRTWIPGRIGWWWWRCKGEQGRIRRPSSGNHRFLLFEVVRSSDVKLVD